MVVFACQYWSNLFFMFYFFSILSLRKFSSVAVVSVFRGYISIHDGHRYEIQHRTKTMPRSVYFELCIHVPCFIFGVTG